ncbi:MAG: hypothetical protein JKY27_05985 [Magnetovibrio sp.]|nr:hypothetical protein [Magnetovibrio sp.]
MENVKDHQLIVHTKSFAFGHFTVEITGPSTSKGTRYVRGFGPIDDLKTSPSIRTLDVQGKVRLDEVDMLGSKDPYLASEPVSIIQAQAV